MQLKCKYNRFRRLRRLPWLGLILAAGISQSRLSAADSPYFVTYTHRMEEPGNLEIASTQVTGTPNGGNTFLSTLLELEYGVKAWWTTELYLSGQGTANQGTLFTGYRLENRIRPFLNEHWINPVVYVEYVDVNGADKTLREIVGHDTFDDQLEPNSEARLERKREIETKLILSSNFKDWNVSENIVAEKNLSNEPWEFGYSMGVSRFLAGPARPRPCTLCRENFQVGLELYGGLGTRHEFGLHDTSQYLAPTIAWRLPSNTTLAFSPSFGLNDRSYGALFRFSIAYEVNQFGRLFKQMGGR